MRRRSTTAFHIVSNLSPTLARIGVVIAVTCSLSDEKMLVNVWIVTLHVTPTALILSPISVGCPWKLPMSFFATGGILTSCGVTERPSFLDTQQTKHLLAHSLLTCPWDN